MRLVESYFALLFNIGYIYANSFVLVDLFNSMLTRDNELIKGRDLRMLREVLFLEIIVFVIW